MTLRNPLVYFYTFILLTIGCVLAAFQLNAFYIALTPFACFIIYIGLVNFKLIYFALLALIPLSLEWEFSNGFATDLPTEPLMLGLSILGVPYFIKHIKKLDFSFFKNPIFIMLLVYFFWMAITVLNSTVPFVSIKFFLAKIWYLIAFTGITAIVINNEKDLRTALWCVLVPLTFTILFIAIKQAQVGFSLAEADKVIKPFYRNHVNYGTTIVVFLPFIFLMRSWYDKASSAKFWLTIIIVIHIAAIYFSYTRAAYLALAGIAAGYFVFKWKLSKLAIPVSIIAVIIGFAFLLNENYYLEFTPTVNTVTHFDFDDKLSATFEGEDVSSMERIYRWIAGIYMIIEKPIMGFGPNGFVPNYENYTVFVFETWASANPERSTVHNYFILTAAEQGIIGLIILILLICAYFLYGEYWYHKKQNKRIKFGIMCAMLCTLSLVINLLFSDMIEVDKTGSFFFMNFALIVILSRDYKNLIPSKTVLQKDQ